MECQLMFFYLKICGCGFLLQQVDIGNWWIRTHINYYYYKQLDQPIVLAIYYTYTNS